MKVFVDGASSMDHMDHFTVLFFSSSLICCKASVAEWLRSFTSNNLPITAVDSNPTGGDEWFLMMKLSTCGGYVVLPGCPSVSVILFEWGIRGLLRPYGI